MDIFAFLGDAVGFVHVLLRGFVAILIILAFLRVVFGVFGQVASHTFLTYQIGNHHDGNDGPSNRD